MIFAQRQLQKVLREHDDAFVQKAGENLYEVAEKYSLPHKKHSKLGFNNYKPPIHIQ